MRKSRETVGALGLPQNAMPLKGPAECLCGSDFPEPLIGGENA
jgi:hypothetical protein